MGGPLTIGEIAQRMGLVADAATRPWNFCAGCGWSFPPEGGVMDHCLCCGRERGVEAVHS